MILAELRQSCKNAVLPFFIKFLTRHLCRVQQIALLVELARKNP